MSAPTDIADADAAPADKPDKDSEDTGFLSFRDSIRTYAEDKLDQVFADMRETLLGKEDAAVAAGKADAGALADKVARDFAAAAKGIGTHTPRLTRTAAEGSYAFTPPGRNAPGRSFYAGAANYGRYVKVLLRPISIAGQGHEKSFADRIIQGDTHLDDLRRAFAKVFGSAALDGVEAAIAGRHTRHVGVPVHHENFPVFFVPGPAGDLQTSPLPSAEAYSAMSALLGDGIGEWRRFKNERNARQVAGEAAEEIAPPRIAPWIFTSSEISGKIRNAALNVRKDRVRFRADFPDLLSRSDGEIYAFAVKGGRFPRLRDPALADTLAFYHERHTAHHETGAHVSREMVKTLDTVADRLIDAAIAWRKEVAEEVAQNGYDRSINEGVADILRTLPVPGKDRAKIFGVLGSSHFVGRLSLKGGA